MTRSFAIKTFLAAALALSLGVAALPASAATFTCYCYYVKDGPSGYCDKGEVGTLPFFQTAATWDECIDKCGNLSAQTGGGTGYMLTGPQPNEHTTSAQQQLGIRCYASFRKPDGYAGSCKTAPKDSSCDQPATTPCNISIPTDAPPPSSVFGASYTSCANNCLANGQQLCGGDVSFSPVLAKPATPTATTDTSTPSGAPTGQGATSNNQIRSGTVLTLPLPLGDTPLPAIIGQVIRNVLSAVGVLVLLFFIWGGMQWMLARGDEAKVSAAKKIITAAVAGFVVIFSSYAILNFILNTVSKA